MSILVKPYEISIWRDEYDSDGILREKKLGTIGTHTMDAQCRALNPNLVRNVNGTKKFSFKMYSQYIDNMTGEKVHNPYIDWLVSERKVKLHYDGKWYDFVIKNISENSATHLYTYQLEDAWVQELSKNGFGMVLDNQLRNNMGTANELAARALAETDWMVADDSEVIVQTVDEALVYVKLPGDLADNIKIKHIIDQTDMTRGVGIEDVSTGALDGKVVLAFYSSCTNKPHRFQFIYSNKGYGKDDDGKYLISRKEDRTIDEKDCQYYIDFDNPSTDYSLTAQGDLGLYLPNGWSEFTPTGEDGDVDSKLSSWYRGKRYGFAQQSEYIPVLDRYCNKYIGPTECANWTWNATEGLDYSRDGIKWELEIVKPNSGWHGITLPFSNFEQGKTYTLAFIFRDASQTMKKLGGHCAAYEIKTLSLDGEELDASEYANGFEIPQDGKKHSVVLTFETNDSNNSNKSLYIQANRGVTENYDKFDLEIYLGQFYYGYLDSNYDSPALKQNLVSNTLFESTSGWTGTTLGGGKKAIVTNVCGRFDGNNFISSLEDLESGKFQSNIKNYKTYLKMEFPSANSVVINSGPYDHRTLLNNIVEGDKFALFSKYGFLSDSSKKPTISVGEYKYQTSSDSYALDNDEIQFSAMGEDYDYTANASINGETVTKEYNIYQTSSSTYTPKNFKNSSQIRMCFAPPSGWSYTKEIEGKDVENPYICYLEEIELFRAVYNGDDLITLDNQVGDLKDRVIDKTYHYYSASTLDGATDKEELKPDHTSKTLTYETYKPVYNAGAEKVRSIAAKESNYFNILQSIAETFEAWLELDIERNDQSDPGKITGKKIRFKNYIGSDNYAGFRYGVNLKDIQRTYESKNLVTKLIVKQNSNELAKDGFCTIARAGANPTGENYIYDFQYFYNTGLLNAKDFFETTYVPVTSGDEPSGPEGYYPRIKDLNKQIQEKNELLANTARDLVKYKADLESATAGLEAAVSAIEETREDFLSACGVRIDDITNGCLQGVSLTTKRQDTKELAKSKNAVYCSGIELEGVYLNLLANDEDGNTHELSFTVNETSEEDRTVWVYIYPKLTIKENTREGVAQQNYAISQEYLVECSIEKNSTEGSGKVKIVHVDTSRYDLNRLINEYSVYSSKELAYASEKAIAGDNVDQTQAIYDSLKEEIDELLEEKRLLNQLFFSKYSRFIQEGTWMSEEYVDDEKYYYDAQSVLYNSCYPQVAYSINVLELSTLPGYELFKFGLGDKTYVEDPEFFGSDLREEVIISEISEMLDDPSKNNIKVQNFKNQFQDLFQKITATVQQAQYSTGAYKKAVALAEANQATKQAFFTDALSGATARLTTAGQQEVDWGNDGITVYSKDNPSDAIRMVGGAILLSKKGEDGIQKWVTGVTSDGVSASLITAGTINAGEISIMNRNQPTFRWDSYGISAYDSVWYDSGYGNVIGGINTEKFVRFDKHGIYGIDNKKLEGLVTQNWIDTNATFALTWEGLKVSGDTGVIARIGKDDENIISITKNVNGTNQSIFNVDNTGSLNISGNITGSVITGSTITSIDDGKSFTLSDQGGSIGGWTFTKNGLYIANGSIKFNSGNEMCASLIDIDEESPIRVAVGTEHFVTVNKTKVYIETFQKRNGILLQNVTYTSEEEWSIDQVEIIQAYTVGESEEREYYFEVNKMEYAYASQIEYSIDEKSKTITFSYKTINGQVLPEELIFSFEVVLFKSKKANKFIVLDDGSVYARAIQIGAEKIGQQGSLFFSTAKGIGKVGSFGIREDWHFTIGDSFGITSNGEVNCSSLRVSNGAGEIDLISSETGFTYLETHSTYNNTKAILCGDYIKLTKHASNHDYSWQELYNGSINDNKIINVLSGRCCYIDNGESKVIAWGITINCNNEEPVISTFAKKI